MTDEQLPADVTTGSPCLQGERVSFTGTLASMTHRQAHEFVEQNGGTATEHVSRQTTMLVVGEEGWPLEEDGRESVKLRQVDEWRTEGLEIRVVNESDWLNLLDLDERRSEVHRLYTPAMLSQLLGVSVHVIRGWERAGLIKPVRKVYRLPYFDFQEVTSARRLSELLSAGVSRKEIESSLTKLQRILGKVDRPLAQLEILASDSHVVVRDKCGLLDPTSGQRLLEFDPPDPSSDIDDEDQGQSLPFSETDFQAHWSADEWFAQGCRLLEDGELDSAIEAYRLCLSEKPGDPEANFHLAEALYRNDNIFGALERYHMAVESDHCYIEAWTQLGCLHVELGQPELALDAFNIALDIHAEYPDARWQKAEVLHLLGRTDESVDEWRAYLEFDSRGPWAETARQRLEEARSLPVIY